MLYIHPIFVDSLPYFIAPASLPSPTSSTEEGSNEAGTRSDEPRTPLKGTPRPTVKNPTYDLVEGVKRSGLKYSMYCGTPNYFLSDVIHSDIAWPKNLPRPLQDAPMSTRRFNHVMQDILIRVRCIYLLIWD